MKNTINRVNCVFCGKKSETRDHIPPKTIFAKPRPQNLISVPSCQQCNHNFSKDDEYFKTVLTMRIDTYNHPDANRNWPAVLRSLRNPQKKGFAKSILSTLEEVDLKSQGGLYIGKSAQFQLNLDRLNKTCARITRGIFYHEYNLPLPISYNVKSQLLETLRDDKVLTNLLQLVMQGNNDIIGNNAFRYWIRQTAEDTFTTVSLLSFYEKVYFIVFSFK